MFTQWQNVLGHISQKIFTLLSDPGVELEALKQNKIKYETNYTKWKSMFINNTLKSNHVIGDIK
jgi:hypothetical protein